MTNRADLELELAIAEDDLAKAVSHQIEIVAALKAADLWVHAAEHREQEARFKLRAQTSAKRT